MKPLQGLRVVERAGSIAGAYCGKLFADHGADVVLVGAASLRRHESLYLHGAKRAVATIAEPGEGNLAAADVVIESSMPEPLAATSLGGPQTVHVQISPYGTSGPRARWKGTDLTDYAASGHLYLYGDPAREPLRGPANQPAFAAGLFGFVGAMAALLARRRLGHGQTVDVSHVQTMAALHQFTLISYAVAGHTACRMGNRYTGQGQPNGLYPCADGWVSIAAPAAHQVEFLLAITGLDYLMDHPDITSVLDFQLHPGLLDQPLTAWLADKTMAEVTELFQTMRIPAGPSLNMLQLLDDPQLIDRHVFSELPGPPSGIRAPRPPFRMTPKAGASAKPWRPGDVTDGPLAGLKVLDLTRVWAGPLCTRILSDLGADVVCVEAPWARGPKEMPAAAIKASRYYPDDDAGACPWNRSGHSIKYQLGKRSLALDLNVDDGKDVLARLVPHHHVLVENYSTRVMPQLGFDEARLHELNPDLLYVTMPGFGRSGPAEHWVAYGSSVDSHAGLASLIGYPDQTPWKGGVAWPDPVAGLHATSAILIGLWQQTEHGAAGCTIEAAQFESTVAVIGDRIVEAQLDGVQVPDGNREPGYKVQGVYPCVGDDQWIAISVVDDAAWTTLVAVTDGELAAVDPGNHDDADRAIAAWTTGREAIDLAHRLQESGIPAAAVATAAMVLTDEHLTETGSFVTVEQPHVGAFTASTTPLTLNHEPLAEPGPAPTLGEHNDAVLNAYGFAATEIERLLVSGTIATEPPA